MVYIRFLWKEPRDTPSGGLRKQNPGTSNNHTIANNNTKQE